MKTKIDKKIKEIVKTFNLNEYGSKFVQADNEYKLLIKNGYSTRRESNIPDIEEKSKLRYRINSNS